MFRISKNFLILKNLNGGKFIYKYPFENLVFINSKPKFNKSNFPNLKKIFLFNENDLYNLTLKPNLENLPNIKIILDTNKTSLKKLPNVKYFDTDKSNYYKQFFLYGPFESVIHLNKFSTNKRVQDEIDYYSQWLNK